MILNTILPPAKIHFIGIGGISMSGIAEMLKNRGYSVSGSDINKSALTEKLISNGINVFYGHNANNVYGCDAVVYTASIKEDNPEYIKAKELNIPIVERCDLLGEISDHFNEPIMISGTHGKTTTTAMISSAFLNCDKNPTISIGGEFSEIGGNYHIGDNKFFISEACEYVESFLTFHPKCAIVLNIEEDHLDYYKDINHIVNAFNKFVSQIKNDGILIYNNDNTNCRKLSTSKPSSKISIGIKEQSLYRATNIKETKDGVTFDFLYDNNFMAKVSLGVSGIHNVYNALACIAVCNEYGLPLDTVYDSLKSFHGVKRRFEYKGDHNSIVQYDDYAHHPSEIKATLSVAKAKTNRNVICVFQPHTYSRTKTLLKEFTTAFVDADTVIVTDIYAAREKDDGSINSKTLVECINEQSHNAKYIKDFNEIANYIKQIEQPNDLVITIGAGDIFKLHNML